MKPIKFSIIFLLCLAALLLLPRTVSTHEPITTTVMFNKEVIRILQRNCLGCHAPNKIKADIPLTTYEEARPWAKAIKEEVLEKRMMPFQAVKGYGNFQHDYTLPQRDVELLVSWIEGGAPRGDVKDYPSEPIRQLIAGKAWSLGMPDLILQPETETRIAAESDGKEQCVSIPTGLKEDRFISAFDFQPGNGAIVHSASFAIETKAAKQRCGPNFASIGQWAPGQSAVRLPDGFGHRLPTGSRIVMKIRYRTNGEAATDHSRIGLYFAKSAPNKPIRNVAVAPSPGAMIPANDAAYRANATLALAEQAEIVAIRPLLFPFAKSIEATAIRPDGTSEVLIWAKGYRYDWQPSYVFKKPVALPRGTRIEVTAWLDNSDDNPNNPNDPPAPVVLKAALCEIALASAAPTKPTLLQQARR
ncbi:MAG: hypothetical protein ACREEM_25770 [Blastocatellia bacterium]